MTQTNLKAKVSEVSQPLKILVADDHFANRLVSQSLLQREGHEITLASNGKEAIRACSSTVFDLILMDIQMPIMNGFEAQKLIKSLKNGNQNIPIFALTAHSQYTEIRTILAKGFHAVLQKPFRVADMIHHLDRPNNSKAELGLIENKPSNAEPKLYIDVMELSLLEVQTLDILLDAIGQDGMCRVLKAYWADAGTMMHSLKSTRLTTKPEAKQTLIELRKTAHGLKGASANIGLLKASRLAAHLQNAPIEDIPYLIEALDRTLHESKPGIRDYCGLTGKATAPMLEIVN